MGMDVTYHPIDPAWAEKAFFAPVRAAHAGDQSAAQRAAKASGLSKGARKAYENLIVTAASWNDPNTPFEEGFGYALCAVQTCFGPYWYTRGTSLTELLTTPGMPAGFAADLRDDPAVISAAPNPSEGRLTQNYRAGVWLPAASVVRLLKAIDADDVVSQAFQAVYSDGQAPVVRTALEWARDHGCGMMEAADLVVPDPVDPRGTQATCWLDNLDLAGVKLYAAMAEKQLRESGAPYDKMTAAAPSWKNL